MAVKLRLARQGTKKRPYFWIVAADSHMPRDGRYLEKLGMYNPRVKPREVEIKADRINYWLDRGAKPSDAVREILREKGILRERAGASAAPVEAPAASEEA